MCGIAHEVRKNAHMCFCVSIERVTRARSIFNRISVRMLIPLTYLDHEMFQCVTVCDDSSSRIVSVCNIRMGGGGCCKHVTPVGRERGLGGIVLLVLYTSKFSHNFSIGA